MESKKPADDLNSLFPYKVCINLDRRPERWRRMEERFIQCGILSVIRFAGIDGQSLQTPATWPYSSGHYGCLQSHLAILRLARENEVPVVLIFEDDCIFDPEFNQKFASCMKQVPADWDLLFLGGKHFEEPIQISENVARAKLTYQTHAYAVNHRIYDVLIELCEGGRGAIDDHTVTLQKDYNCYCFVPNLIWQERIDSDTRG